MLSRALYLALSVTSMNISSIKVVLSLRSSSTASSSTSLSLVSWVSILYDQSKCAWPEVNSTKGNILEAISSTPNFNSILIDGHEYYNYVPTFVNNRNSTTAQNFMLEYIHLFILTSVSKFNSLMKVLTLSNNMLFTYFITDL